MAITSRTIVDQIEVTNALAVQARFARLIEETAADGAATELSRMYHRTNVERNGPIEEQIADVAAHLTEMGWPEIDPDGLDRVRRIAAAVWADTDPLTDYQEGKWSGPMTTHAESEPADT